MKKRGGASGSQGAGSSGEANSDGKVDIKVSLTEKLFQNKHFLIVFYFKFECWITFFFAVQVRQWAEIQARSRKMSPAEFLSFAEQKKTELQTALEVRLTASYFSFRH